MRGRCGAGTKEYYCCVAMKITVLLSFLSLQFIIIIRTEIHLHSHWGRPHSMRYGRVDWYGVVVEIESGERRWRRMLFTTTSPIVAAGTFVRQLWNVGNSGWLLSRDYISWMTRDGSSLPTIQSPSFGHDFSLGEGRPSPVSGNNTKWNI